jgi:uncharacterized protein YbjT (DUF2867 family)
MIPDGFTLIAGSLGDQGGSVAQTLKQSGRHIRALTHNRWSPAATRLLKYGVEVLSDDLETPEVTVRDVAGAADVFAAFTPFDEGGFQTELRHVRNLGWAAVRAGVEHFVYSSIGDPEQDRDAGPGDLWGVERLLGHFELPLTMLRPAFFMENLDEFALRRDRDGDLVLRLPLAERARAHWIALSDVGALVRTAFDRPDAFGREPVVLAADELSFAEVAGLIGETLGEDVRYEQIPLGEVKDRRARGMYRWFQDSARYEPDVEKLRRLRPELLTVRRWLAAGSLDLKKVEQRSAAA